MTEYPLLTLNTPTGLITHDNIMPASETARNITADLNNRLFVPIPAGDRVRHRHVCIVGKQECGKTVTANFLVSKAIEKYGADSVNIVYTDDPRVFIELINDRPVQIGVIDDATSFASSREVHKQADFLKNYNRSRHIYEDKFPGKPGIMMYIFSWQRWIELDPALRDGHVMLFKTGMTGWQDRRDIIDKVGKDYFDVLNKSIWDPMERGNEAIKSVSVARIASKLPEDGGVGLYVSDMVQWCLPDMIRSEEYFKTDTATVDEILEKYRTQPKWSLRIECYDLHITGEYTQTEIADILSEKHGKTVRQGYVSEAVSKVMELLKR